MTFARIRRRNAQISFCLLSPCECSSLAARALLYILQCATAFMPFLEPCYYMTCI